MLSVVLFVHLGRFPRLKAHAMLLGQFLVLRLVLGRTFPLSCAAFLQVNQRRTSTAGAILHAVNARRRDVDLVNVAGATNHRAAVHLVRCAALLHGAKHWRSHRGRTSPGRHPTASSILTSPKHSGNLSATARHHAAVHLMSPTALFHAANMLFAIAKLIGLLHVLVDETVNSRHLSFAASFTRLATGMAHVHFAFNLAALLKLARRHGAHPGQNVSLKRIRRGIVAGVYPHFRVSSNKAFCLGFVCRSRGLTGYRHWSTP